ncbi:MAG: secondary thiamine-phosphate synthase enzyme YjbQ [Bacteroidetes bacterium]|nr:secondary thiamine-phosphate synthase enzyme YjbQ [Bacteroidota bacterium]
MEVITENLHVTTHGNTDVIDITDEVANRVRKNGLNDGIVTVFVVGSTACVTTTEYEPGLRKDIPAMLERIAPTGVRYSHDDTWGDGNGHSHIRAAFIGPSLTIPVCSGNLQLGTWQQIVLIECDIRGRNRTIILQMIGTRK